MLSLLPSQAATSLKNALAYWDENDEIVICEPCDCGSQVRHNNGGNYHEIVTIAKDGGQVFVKYDTTCELTAPAQWEEITETKAREVIANYSDWL